MTHIDDILDTEFLEAELEAGNVRVRTHPDNDALCIFNYTEQAQYTKHWNDVTRRCRGLIVEMSSGRVLARPFDKFFNVGEYGADTFDPTARVRVADKLDGSLGILYTAPDGLPAIATRGSFTSEQAIHATALLRDRYRHFEPRPGMTYLFEIVYPENRIVLDYGDMDDLVLLGARNIETGRTWGPDVGLYIFGLSHWTGPRAETFPQVRTFVEALKMGDRENREGLVITFLNSGLMVKVKQEDYVLLHKLVTGLNERAVWEHMAGHEGRIFGLLESIPDEFHEWVKKVSDDLFERHDVLQGRAHHAYHHTVADLDHVHGEDAWERKDFALSARNHYPDLTPLLFHLLDGRDISPAIWKTLKPKGETASLMDRTEDVA